MENASKALIIAGAVLISILLITFGIMIMGSTDGVKDQMSESMTEMEISSFNSKFLEYEGTTRKASQVKTLINAIATSNTATGTSSGDEKFVAIEFTPKGEEEPIKTTDAARAAVKSPKTYTVTCTIGTTGLVTKVSIAEN